MLAWVIVEEALRHVSDFAELKPRLRPRATCPVCEERLTLKLGRRVSHHAAHRAGAHCRAAHPETAVHLNCKFHLARELSGAAELTIRRTCSGDSALAPCDAMQDATWVSGWDRVEVEMRLGTRRPDLTLFAGSEVVGAIEVCVTNAIDAARAADLDRLGVTWIEVSGSRQIFYGDEPWRHGEPLVVQRVSGKPWLCDTCEQAQAERLHRESNGPRVRWARIVDFFFPSGKKLRDVFEVVEHLIDSRAAKVTLERRRLEAPIATEMPPITKDSYKALTAAFRAHLKREQTRKRAVVDSPMTWVNPDDAILTSNAVVFGGLHYPYRYQWDAARRHWKQVDHTRWDDTKSDEE